MRKLLTLLVALTLATSFGCCSKMRNWFHKGAPCGTQTYAPNLVGPPASQLPLAPPMQVTVPVATMAQPSYAVQPNYGVTCCPDPCAVPCCPDPCATSCCENTVVGSSNWVPQSGGTTTYFGGITDSGAGCGCNDGGAIQDSPPAQYLPPSSVPDAASGDDGGVGDPRPIVNGGAI